ncbi:MAG: hypothetical protein Q8O32_03610 [bacterium]|nr:hypothetical protein [bacterium]
MKKLFGNPWTVALVLLLAQVLTLFFLTSTMAKLMATVVAVGLSLSLVSLENRSTRSFIIGVSVAVVILAIFVTYIKMARFFAGQT